MAEYKRWVSYVYTYENEERKSNIGFVRLEVRGNQCKVVIHLTFPGMYQENISLYLFGFSKQVMRRIPIGAMVVRNAIGSFQGSVSIDTVKEQGCSIEELKGLLLLKGKLCVAGAAWDDSILTADVMKALEEETADNRKENKKIMDTEPPAAEIITPLKHESEDIDTKEQQNQIPEATYFGTALQGALASDTNVETMQERFTMQEAFTGEEAFAREEPQREPVQEIERWEAEPKQAQGMERWMAEPKQAQENERGEAEPKQAQGMERWMAEPKQVQENERSKAGPKQAQGMERRMVEPKQVQDSERGKAEPKQAQGMERWMAEPKQVQDSERSKAEPKQVQDSERSKAEPNQVQETIESKEDWTKRQLEGKRRGMGQERNRSVRKENEIPLQEKQDVNEGWISMLENTVPGMQKHHTAKEALYGLDRMHRPFKLCPTICPFEDGELAECVKIEPQDIGLLPLNAWGLTNNSFLLHGFYSYGHLVFARKETRGGSEYFLMVPGVYCNKERNMARKFGFGQFKACRRKEQKQGEFGYWFIKII